MKRKIKKLLFCIILPIICFSVIGSFGISSFISGYASAYSGNGGVFYISKYSDFYHTKGSISNSTAKNGGAYYVSGGKLYMSGGEIYNNTVSANGGGVYIDNSGLFNMSNGHIYNNYYIDKQKNTHQNDIYNAGTFVMTGGTIGSLQSVVYKRVDDNDKASITGDYIYFGSYPQTIKSDDVQIYEDKVNSKGYYLGSDGEQYAKITATIGSPNTFSNNEVVQEGVDYYFKVEPIKWLILSEDNGQAIILSELILDAHQFYNDNTNSRPNSSADCNDIRPYDYKYSDIRAWLNGYAPEEGNEEYGEDCSDNGFLQLAFSEEEQNRIQSMLVDNGLSTGINYDDDYICEVTYGDTNDKVWLLSYSDLSNPVYDPQKIVGDYACAKMATSPTGSGDWWLRSPGLDSCDASHCNRYGDLTVGLVDEVKGVVPAMQISLYNLPDEKDYGVINNGGSAWIYGGTVNDNILFDNKSQADSCLVVSPDATLNGILYLKGNSLLTVTYKNQKGEYLSFDGTKEYIIKVDNERADGVVVKFLYNGSSAPDLSKIEFVGTGSLYCDFYVEYIEDGSYDISGNETGYWTIKMKHRKVSVTYDQNIDNTLINRDFMLDGTFEDSNMSFSAQLGDTGAYGATSDFAYQGKYSMYITGGTPSTGRPRLLKETTNQGDSGVQYVMEAMVYSSSSLSNVVLAIEANGGDYSWEGFSNGGEYTTPGKWQHLMIITEKIMSGDVDIYFLLYTDPGQTVYIDNLNIYTIYNDEEISTLTKNYECGDRYEDTYVPERVGYEFKGWTNSIFDMSKWLARYKEIGMPIYPSTDNLVSVNRQENSITLRGEKDVDVFTHYDHYIIPVRSETWYTFSWKQDWDFDPSVMIFPKTSNGGGYTRVTVRGGRYDVDTGRYYLTFRTSSDERYISVRFGTYDEGEVTFSECKLEEGSRPTEYIVQTGTTVTNPNSHTLYAVWSAKEVALELDGTLDYNTLGYQLCGDSNWTTTETEYKFTAGKSEGRGGGPFMMFWGLGRAGDSYMVIGQKYRFTFEARVNVSNFETNVNFENGNTGYILNTFTKSYKTYVYDFVFNTEENNNALTFYGENWDGQEFYIRNIKLFCLASYGENVRPLNNLKWGDHGDGSRFEGWYYDMSYNESTSDNPMDYSNFQIVNMGRDYLYQDSFNIQFSVYSANWANFGFQMIFSSADRGGVDIEASLGYIHFIGYDYGHGYRTATASLKWSDLSSGWHTFKLIFDGNYLTVYLDGGTSPIATSNAFVSGKIGYKPSNSLFVGGEAVNSPNMVDCPSLYNFIGKIANFAVSHTSSTGNNETGIISVPAHNVILHARMSVKVTVEAVTKDNKVKVESVSVNGNTIQNGYSYEKYQFISDTLNMDYTPLYFPIYWSWRWDRKYSDSLQESYFVGDDSSHQAISYTISKQDVLIGDLRFIAAAACSWSKQVVTNFSNTDIRGGWIASNWDGTWQKYAANGVPVDGGKPEIWAKPAEGYMFYGWYLRVLPTESNYKSNVYIPARLCTMIDEGSSYYFIYNFDHETTNPADGKPGGGDLFALFLPVEFSLGWESEIDGFIKNKFPSSSWGYITSIQFCYSNPDSYNYNKIGRLFSGIEVFLNKNSTTSNIDIAFVCSGDIYAPKDATNLFSRLKWLETITLSNFYTVNTTNMSSMFYDCQFLTSFYGPGFNTYNTTNMKYMFYNCKSLVTLDLSNFNIQNLSAYVGMLTLNATNLSTFRTPYYTNVEIPITLASGKYLYYGTSRKTSVPVGLVKSQTYTNSPSSFIANTYSAYDDLTASKTLRTAVYDKVDSQSADLSKELFGNDLYFEKRRNIAILVDNKKYKAIYEPKEYKIA